MTDTENQVRGAHEVALAKLKQVRETVAGLREQEGKILSQIRDCEAAARLFAFDLPVLEVRKAPPANGPENVREFTLEFLKNAGEGVKSVTIRAAYEIQFRKHIHPKTIGMTLYRLKKDGLAEINGRIWRPLPHPHCP